MSKLETQILPEIVNDELSSLLKVIASQDDVETILEIGTGSGDGSTSAIVAGLEQNKNESKQFFTIEISSQRADQAREQYKEKEYLSVLCGCSASTDKYMSDEEITSFYNTKITALNKYPLEMVLGWKKEELDYISQNDVKQNLIKEIKTKNKIKFFDLVLIDGSEFTGVGDLKQTIGSKYIVLDDINAAKNFGNYKELTSQFSGYILFHENWSLRNGFAIFKKK